MSNLVEEIKNLLNERQYNIQSGRLGWVSRGNNFKSEDIPGVTFIYADKLKITVNENYGPGASDHWDLGYSRFPLGKLKKYRRHRYSPGHILFDIAYGYVNGFPILDILYFVMTRDLNLDRGKWRA